MMCSFLQRHSPWEDSIVQESRDTIHPAGTKIKEGTHKRIEFVARGGGQVMKKIKLILARYEDETIVAYKPNDWIRKDVLKEKIKKWKIARIDKLNQGFVQVSIGYVDDFIKELLNSKEET